MSNIETACSGTGKPNARYPQLNADVRSIALLTALAAVGQFASNIYTPSLPFVAAELNITAAQAQSTFGVFLLSFAAMQLVYGPLADRFGRRPVLFTAFTLFLLGTIICAMAANLQILLAGRTVQAAGAAGALIVSRAVTRDRFDGIELQKVMTTITIAFALVPGLTPLLGGVTQELAGWRAAFWLTLVLGAVTAAVAFRRLPETNTSAPQRLMPGAILSSYATVLADRVALTYALTTGLVFAAMSAYFAASPALFIGQLGVGAAEYGLYPPIAVTGFIFGGIVTRRLVGKVSPQRIAGIGLGLMVVALIFMFAMPAAGLVHKHLFNAAMVLNVTGLGVFLPTAISQVLARFPERAGTASAVQGFIQMFGGAAGVFAVGAIQPQLPVLAMPGVMLAAVLTAVFVFRFAMLPATAPKPA